MEKTRFQEALTAFNNEVRKAAEEVRRQMEEIGIDKIAVNGRHYRVAKARHKGYKKQYLAVVTGELFKDVKSLEDTYSTNFMYDADATWIEAATTDERITFMKDVKKLIEAVGSVADIKIAEMESAVMAANDHQLPLLPIDEVPGFEGTKDDVNGLVAAARKAAGIEKGGAR